MERKKRKSPQPNVLQSCHTNITCLPGASPDPQQMPPKMTKELMISHPGLFNLGFSVSSLAMGVKMSHAASSLGWRRGSRHCLCNVLDLGNIHQLLLPQDFVHNVALGYVLSAEIADTGIDRSIHGRRRCGGRRGWRRRRSR